MKITKTGFRAGVWRGVLHACSGTPLLSLRHPTGTLPPPQVTPSGDAPGRWDVSVALPASLLGDGMSCVQIVDETSDAVLASIFVAGGDMPEDDLRAELQLLRSEVTLLKRAFRAHCASEG